MSVTQTTVQTTKINNTVGSRGSTDTTASYPTGLSIIPTTSKVVPTSATLEPFSASAVVTPVISAGVAPTYTSTGQGLGCFQFQSLHQY